MNITWQDFFSIVKSMWGLSDSSLATYLGYHRSTVGLIVKGETKRLTLENDEIFTALFDPTKNSPAAKRGEKHTFDELKKIIKENEGFSEATESLNHDDYKDFVMGLLRLARKSEPIENESQSTKKSLTPELSPAQYESALKEFERVIAKYSFEEFIESEPLLRFIARSEPEANRQKLRYNKYVDRVCDNEITLHGFCHEYERYFAAGSQIENIQYTDKLLTSTLLTMSKQLVDVLAEKIFPATKTLDRHVRKNIFEFKEALGSYNELLVENLGVKNDSFVFDPDVTDYEDENSTVEEADYASEAVSEKYNINLDMANSIPICKNKNEDIDTEFSNTNIRYRAFHLATRIMRAKIFSLYKEIKDEINS